MDRHLDLIEWNEAYAGLWADPAAVPPPRRNLLLTTLESKALAVRPPDTSSMAWHLVRQLRAHAARSPDKRFGQVFALLRRERPELAAWWRCKSVAEFSTRHVVMHGMEFMVSMLRPAQAPDCAVCIQAPSSAADRAMLASMLWDNLRRAG